MSESTAPEAQSAASEEINQAVDQINDIASETGMRQTSEAIRDMAEQAKNLRALVSDLKRARAAHRPAPQRNDDNAKRGSRGSPFRGGKTRVMPGDSISPAQGQARHSPRRTRTPRPSRAE